MAQGAFTAEEARQANRLTAVVALVGAFFVLELAGAMVADSVVLQADALHLLMDVLALGVSLLAMRVAVRAPSERFTYGLRRAEPVAAIFSAILVLVTTVVIVLEGAEALHGGEPPKAGVMLLVAVLAMIVNGASAWMIHDALGHRGHGHAGHEGGDHHDGHDRGPHREGHDGDHGHDHHRGHAHGNDHDLAHAHEARGRRSRGHALNLRGAWLHLLGDTLGAVAAVVAALIIRFGGSPKADPIASFIVAAILLVGSLRLLGDATLVLLEAAPPHLPVATIRRIAAGFPDVTEVIDLHVWTLGAGHDAITVHVRTASPDPQLGTRLSARLQRLLGADYVTVQVHVDGS
jgi:cation diffusion facilitator family transporter